MELHHGNMIDGTSLIGECTDENVWRMINEYLDKINYKSYYLRRWKEAGDITVIDYGSHTQFFYIVK